MNYKSTANFALELDAYDELRNYRNEFYIPLQKNGEEHIYMCGNSLGLQPKRTKQFLNQELDDWATFGVEGHFLGKNPWFSYLPLTGSKGEFLHIRTDKLSSNEIILSLIIFLKT